MNAVMKKKTLASEVSKIKFFIRDKTILLLVGGDSNESTGSLEDGANILLVLKKYAKRVIIFDPQSDIYRLPQLLKRADLVYVAMYGGYGENGEMQGLLHIFNKKFSGSRTVTSAIGMNKYFFIKLLSADDLPVPRSERLDKFFRNKNAKVAPKPPFVLKPVDGGDSYGILLIPNIKTLLGVIKKIAKDSWDKWILEEYCPGDPATVGVIGVGKNKVIVGDLIVLKLPKGEKIYSAKLKYCGHKDLKYINIKGGNIYKKIERDVVKLYRLLHCYGFVRFDIMIARNSYKFIEMNTFPGLYIGSNLEHSFRDYTDFESLVVLNI